MGRDLVQLWFGILRKHVDVLFSVELSVRSYIKREIRSQAELFELRNQNQKDVSIMESRSVCYLNVRHLHFSHFIP